METLHRVSLPGAFIATWTSGYVVGALGTRVVPPETLTLWRFLVAAAVMAAIALVRRDAWPRGGEVLHCLAVGVLLFGVQFGALYYGMSVGVPAATTALVACCAPLVVAAGSSLLGWDRLRRTQWLGIGLGVAGVALTLADRVGRPPHVADLGWTVLGLLGLAGGTMLHGRIGTAAGPAGIGAVELLGGAAPIAVLAPFAGALAIPGTVDAVAPFVWLCLVAGVGAPLLLFALIRQRGAVEATSLLFVVPATTALVSWPVLGEPVGTTAFVGLVVAGVGLLLALRRGGDARRPVMPPEPARDLCTLDA